MARYDFRCKECEAVKSAVLKMDDRNTVPECDECGGLMKRIYSGHAVIRVPHPRDRNAGATGNPGGFDRY